MESDDSSDVDVDNLVPIEGSWTTQASHLARISAILDGTVKRKRLRKNTNHDIDDALSSSSSPNSQQVPKSSENLKRKRSVDDDDNDDDNESILSDLFPVSDDEDTVPPQRATRDSRIDQIRIERLNRRRQEIAEKIEERQPVDRNDVKIHRLFGMVGNANETRRRINLDDLQLTWQACMNKYDKEILDELGPDPGKSKCYGCTCSQTGEGTDSENRLRILTNMWFENWAYTNEIELSKSLSEYANTKIIPFHRNKRKADLQRDHRTSRLTERQIEAMLFSDWSPSSIYHHFNKHTPHPMAFWCKNVKRYQLMCDFIWENGAWMLDLIGENPKEQINPGMVKLYLQLCDKVLMMFKQKPETWVMPSIHTVNIIRNSGMLRKRETFVEQQNNKFDVII